jgi:serine kinase of HPr protein (carbohydrate metabolism regulator)
MIAHATCIALAGAGVLLRGPSGSGKSNLALRLMERGARLVADDCTALSRDGDAVLARAPETVRGVMEVRGVGVVRVPYQESIAVDLIVDLLPAPDAERVPEPGSDELLGRPVRRIALHAFEEAALAKLELAARLARREDAWLT